MVLDLLRDRTTTQQDCGMVLQEYRLSLSKVAHNLPVLILYHTRLVLGCEKDRLIIEYLGLRSYNLKTVGDLLFRARQAARARQGLHDDMA